MGGEFGRAPLAGFDKAFLHRLDSRSEADLTALPMTVKVLLEGLLRAAAEGRVKETDVAALARWPEAPPPGAELPFTPARVLLQDFTGVPAVVDLAAMRSAMERAGKDAGKIDPLVPADLVIDHSVQVDVFGSIRAYDSNIVHEYERNHERYAVLNWAQQGFNNFSVVPPGMGICHQVNLEHLAKVVQVREAEDGRLLIPDTLVGTDSHTPMVNGLGVLGWGVGGIEAEAALLGQPMFLTSPVVVGVKFSGALRPGATATDLVLTLTEMLRKHGVVNKFVEFCGSGLSSLSVPDRATLSNMCPEYGATASLFPVDAQTLRYLELTGRDPEHIKLVEAYCREQSLFRSDESTTPQFTELLELDLATVEPSLAGPRRPQDRHSLPDVWQSFTDVFGEPPPEERGNGPARMDDEGGTNGESQKESERTGGGVATAVNPGVHVADGSVVIAAITSCTNTSNPSVMVAAGLLAKAAVERGLEVHPHVKTSLAPGSRVVTDYLKNAGLMEYLEKLGFYLVGYGCTTCIGNSGPLASPEIEQQVVDGNLSVAAVLSGNRNFEARIHPLVKASYLGSPPLVVAYALAGNLRKNLATEPLGTDRHGKPVLLSEIWPSPELVAQTVGEAVRQEMYTREYAKIFEGDENWKKMDAPTGASFAWDPKSTYVQEPPYFLDFEAEPKPPADVVDARCLVMVADSVTTDHISPAGSIPADSPAGRYLIEQGVEKLDFNSYGARRGNHEVMVRGTFANIRLRNELAGGKEGYWTTHQPDGDEMTIFDASNRYREEATPLIVLAGKEYGSGSSRDWAAKGPLLLGIRAVIAESFERIHRSNLVGMGILPLEFSSGESRQSLGLTGREKFTIRGFDDLSPRKRLTVDIEGVDGAKKSFEVTARLDNETDVEYLRHGGVLPMVLRDLMTRA
ncbi:MAG: aconitate hydratase AcnA [Candidatus Dormibacteraeota bacterium]|nr:aconitate hydratase AcnA [Candidatus Dormibacteraeota bacterium]